MSRRPPAASPRRPVSRAGTNFALATLLSLAAATATAQPVPPRPRPVGPIVRPIPTPIPGPIARVALPDLAVAGVRAQPTRVLATVRNVGAATPGLRATASLLVGGRPVAADAVVPALAPGAEVELAFAVAQRPGETFELAVDADARVSDRARDNNRRRGAWPAIATGRDGVDPLLARAAAAYGAPNVAVARFPDNSEVPFIDDRLLLTTGDQAMLAGLLARTGGTVIDRIDRPAAMGKPPTYVIRVTKRADAATEFTPAERAFAFSGAAARDLLATAMRERRAGVPVGIDPVLRPQGILEGKTREGGGNDGLSLDYMTAGGLFDVNVRDAWRALLATGKLDGPKSTRIGIVDSGFSWPRPGFTELEFNPEFSNGGNPSPILCSGGGACPWHGTGVAKAAAGLADNQIGAAGPAGPVARLILVDRGLAGSSGVKAMWDAYNRGARIINMSFTGEQPRDTGWFTSTWPSWLKDWEDDTRWLANQGDTLLFAAAGNEGRNVDARNGDGDEAAWWYPCENQGVICVGGWADTQAGTGQPGRVPDPGSNYSYPGGDGEVVDINGPYCMMVGDDPDTVGVNVTQRQCGTSLASPFVAGVAALVRAANPGLTAQQAWALLRKHASAPFPLLPGGRVHAYRAVREALMMAGGNHAPIVAITAPLDQAEIGQSPFATPLNAFAYDVEDEFNCCAATWFLGTKPIATGKPSASFAFAGQALGSRTLKLRVTDTAGGDASQVVTVRLVAPKPQISIRQDVPGALTRGLPARFTMLLGAPGGASPAAGACPTAIWSAAASAGLSPTGAAGCAPMLTFANAGPAKLMLTYTDAFGQKAFADLAVSVVAPASGTPAAVILEPAGGKNYDLDEWIALKWSWTGTADKPKASWTLTALPGGKPQPLKFTMFFGQPKFRIGDTTGNFKLPNSGPTTYELTLTLTAANGKKSKPVSRLISTNFIIG